MEGYIMKLKELRKIGKGLGVRIEADRDDTGWGYWLIKDDGSGEGIWSDENFCTSLYEVLYKLEIYKAGVYK
jgi:hypothetical protein